MIRYLTNCCLFEWSAEYTDVGIQINIFKTKEKLPFKKKSWDTFLHYFRYYVWKYFRVNQLVGYSYGYTMMFIKFLYKIFFHIYWHFYLNSKLRYRMYDCVWFPFEVHQRMCMMLYALCAQYLVWFCIGQDFYFIRCPILVFIIKLLSKAPENAKLYMHSSTQFNWKMFYLFLLLCFFLFIRHSDKGAIQRSRLYHTL